jgi:hypothetical protein
MSNTASLKNVASVKEQEYKVEFHKQFNDYLERQHPIVKAVHEVLKAAAMICLALPVIFGFIGLYYTYLWATTGSFTSLGQATYLPLAWVNFGLSCSFMVFPWGLDAMLMRAFPTNAVFQTIYGRATKRIKFITGLGAFFAGFGIMCAGAPGAARMFELASQFIQRLF